MIIKYEILLIIIIFSNNKDNFDLIEKQNDTFMMEAEMLYGSLITPLDIGTPSTRLFFNIDITYPISIITASSYDIRWSKTGKISQPLSTYTFQDNNHKINVIQIKDLIQFKNKDKAEFNFYQNAMVLQENGNILNFNYNNNIREKDNFLDKLKKNKLINNKRFFINYHSIESLANIYIGNIPNEIYKRFKFFSACNVNNQYNNWNCPLNQVRLDNNKAIYNMKYDKERKHYNTFIYFRNNVTHFSIPYDVFKYINKTMFQKYYKENYCNYIGKIAWDTKIKCLCSKIKDFPNITLVINGYEYILDYKVLFDEEEYDTCYSNLVFNTDPKFSDKYILGSSFLEKFNPLFDIERNRISFFSNDAILLNEKLCYEDCIRKIEYNIIKNEEETNNSEIMKELFFFNMIICFFLSIFLIFIYKFKYK